MVYLYQDPPFGSAGDGDPTTGGDGHRTCHQETPGLEGADI